MAKYVFVCFVWFVLFLFHIKVSFWASSSFCWFTQKKHLQNRSFLRTQKKTRPNLMTYFWFGQALHRWIGFFGHQMPPLKRQQWPGIQQRSIIALVWGPEMVWQMRWVDSDDGNRIVSFQLGEFVWGCLGGEIPPQNLHIPPKGKRKTIDSKVSFDGIC